eukprot:COSAG03_NODE_328_length_8950_cov_24.961021_10_plen_65_part_00
MPHIRTEEALKHKASFLQPRLLEAALGDIVAIRFSHHCDKQIEQDDVGLLHKRVLARPAFKSVS